MALRRLVQKVPPLAWIVLAPLLLLLAVAGTAWLWTVVSSWHRVDAGAWRMTVYVHRFGPVTDAGSCRTVPPGARDVVPVGRGLETYQSGSRQGSCHQDCATRTHVVGGKVRTQQDCKMVCDRVPVYASREYDRCQWVVDAWREIGRTAVTGQGLAAATRPSDVSGGARPQTAPLGTEWRSAYVTYERLVTGLFGREWLCTFHGDSRWLALEAGEWFRIPKPSTDNDLFCFNRDAECARADGTPPVLCNAPPQ